MKSKIHEHFKKPIIKGSKKVKILIPIFLSVFTLNTMAQELPQPSPKAKLEQRVGLTDISITYCRPGVKERTIWGDLVPYDKMWRTGANKPVQFAISTAIEVNGNKLDSGTYTVFTIPGKEEWTVIFNKNTELWGTGGYKEEEDVFKFNVKPQQAPFRERMIFTVDNMTDGSADIVLHWEKVSISFPITVDYETQAMKNIEKAIAKAEEGEWRVYTRAADYCVESGKNLDKALKWVDKALEMEDYWWSRWVKADVLAAQKEYKGAIKNAKKAIELGEEKYKDDEDGFSYKEKLEKSISEWKGSM